MAFASLKSIQIEDTEKRSASGIQKNISDLVEIFFDTLADDHPIRTYPAGDLRATRAEPDLLTELAAKKIPHAYISGSGGTQIVYPAGYEREMMKAMHKVDERKAIGTKQLIFAELREKYGHVDQDRYVSHDEGLLIRRFAAQIPGSEIAVTPMDDGSFLVSCMNKDKKLLKFLTRYADIAIKNRHGKEDAKTYEKAKEAKFEILTGERINGVDLDDRPLLVSGNGYCLFAEKDGFNFAYIGDGNISRIMQHPPSVLYEEHEYDYLRLIEEAYRIMGDEKCVTDDIYEARTFALQKDTTGFRFIEEINLAMKDISVPVAKQR